MDFTAARKAMVDSQVRVNDVTDRHIHAAMLTVQREAFCAPDRAFAAYADGAVEIAGERKLMPARDVAKLLQAAEAREGERALAIAAPYAGAVLARMGLKVTAQEADQAVLDIVAPALAAEGAETVLAPLDQPVGENWDLIVCEGAVVSAPEAWGAALRPGGRMVVVERRSAVGKAALYVKGREGLSRRELFDSAPAMLAALTPAPTFAL
ncbi:MAG: protein-L-isoaspartate O-methyltransferase [Brevundimonas sp.]|uniref:Protein-L-isoaspartate O-methyltransferase n=1 Tax=Brevundimonas albigilva TaxID=1312364 RepID=A0ABY4SQA8_9CAUL|nr:MULTISPECIES: protein-L-isoaspartate O-methyltransferase [Brevundimonas]MCV0413344.1 protein-L-isoaspartate O-methyltransferase [Brevundimonas sp.]PZU61343.1 MAG: protein-L-isoaspartate O-methyltransferase [Brevundimonas sp.]URI16469.1 protein-L-isoaspartate O-methyltransferase [Brevundimonas albigilva]